MKIIGIGKWLLVCVAVCCAVAQASTPRSVRTIRRSVRTERTVYEPRSVVAITDTLTGEDARGRISGYDKPLRSRYETALFTNQGPKSVEQASLRLVYKDMKGRMLHSCRVRVDVGIEPGETGQIKWRSWDVQQTYYYHRSRRPRLSTAVPYSVECEIDTIFVSR